MAQPPRGRRRSSAQAAHRAAAECLPGARAARCRHRVRPAARSYRQNQEAAGLRLPAGHMAARPPAGHRARRTPRARVGTRAADLVGRQTPAVGRSRHAELLDLRGCGSRVHAKVRSKSRRRPSLRPAGTVPSPGHGRSRGGTRRRPGSPKKPVCLSGPLRRCDRHHGCMRDRGAASRFDSRAGRAVLPRGASPLVVRRRLGRDY
jgi:hypothetical protein